MFRSPLKPSLGGHGRTSLRYGIGMLIYICYTDCRYVAVCQFIPTVCVCVCVCVWGRGYLSGRDVVFFFRNFDFISFEPA
jgi:hypothetical protein